MKKKILDTALLLLLSGAAPLAFGQAADTPAPCAADTCRGPDGALLFRLQTRGAHDAAIRGTDSATLAPDRRVTVEQDRPAPGQAGPVARPGRAVATGKFSVQVPGGGIIWATEDPTLGQAELSVSAPAEVAFENGRLTAPVPFFLRSNYPAFVKRFELTIYRASDTAQTEALARLNMPVAAVSRVDWQGKLASRFPLRAGDELVYVLRAFGARGEVDETRPRLLKLVRPEDAERSSALLRASVERSMGTALSARQAQSQSLIHDVFAGNDLQQQNIPITGSRIRIQGRNLPADTALLINGESYPVDLERKFVAEFLAPVGRHAFDIEVRARDQAVLRHALGVEVTGKYRFAMAIADLTLYQNHASGPGRDIALADRDSSVLADGRLAFYGKAKVDGKYLITAHADTQEREVKDLFKGFFKADPQDIFRRLDPYQYYPVYGDDSTTERDVDTQGRLYVRVDWDKNQALWGNFLTDITGTQYAQYVRALYGAALKWRYTATNRWGEPLTQVRAFASEAQTAPGHSEFIGTGGSLYYLRHTDILPGSETIVVEVRNPATGNVEERRRLQRGVDYQLNELQGRILLVRPLMQLVGQGAGSITRDVPGAGFEQRLIVDYEWMPRGYDGGNLAAGVRAKHWLTDHVAVGGTLVNEERAGEDYELKGVDLTLQAGRGTWLRVEHSESRATGAPVFFSANGGFSFSELNASAAPRSGSATAVQAEANLQEQGWTARNTSIGAWWRDVDAGFSVARDDIGVDRQESGVEARSQLSDTTEVLASHSRATRGAERLDQTQVTGRWRPNDDGTLTGELRRIEERRVGGTTRGALGALKYSHRVTPGLELYGIGQLTLDDDDGRYADNDAYTVGGRYSFANLSVVGAEFTHGDRGNAAQVNAETRLSPEHTVYGSLTRSTDRSDYDSLFNARLRSGWTLGQRWRVGERSNLFNESQYLKEPGGSGILHTFGMDFYPVVGWSTGFTLQNGDLDTAAGALQRRAVSVSATRFSAATEWRGKLEWREDSGAEQRRQWVLMNRLSHKLNEDWRLSANANYADTRDDLNAAAGARFVEASVGFAWRPHDTTRYALLGRYTYLYDLSTLGQVNAIDHDQKSHILSLEGTYRLDRQWGFAARLAHREGSARSGRSRGAAGTGQWFDSAATLAAVQARYSLPQQWHALGEWRALSVKNGGVRSGFLVGVDRDVTRNLRLGVGYNFTDFSDDLTRFDYRYRGWFINLVGSY